MSTTEKVWRHQGVILSYVQHDDKTHAFFRIIITVKTLSGTGVLLVLQTSNQNIGLLVQKLRLHFRGFEFNMSIWSHLSYLCHIQDGSVVIGRLSSIGKYVVF